MTFNLCPFLQAFISFQIFRSNENVIERKLVSEKINKENIIKYHKTFCKDTKKVSHGDVLGYVTPVCPYLFYLQFSVNISFFFYFIFIQCIPFCLFLSYFELIFFKLQPPISIISTSSTHSTL